MNRYSIKRTGKMRAISSIFTSLFTVSCVLSVILPFSLKAETLVVQRGVSELIETDATSIDDTNKKPQFDSLKVGVEERDGSPVKFRSLLSFDFSRVSEVVGEGPIAVKGVTLSLFNRSSKANASEIPVQVRLLGDGSARYAFTGRLVKWSTAPLDHGGTVGELLTQGTGISRIYAESEFPSTPAFEQAVQKAINSREPLRMILVSENETETGFTFFFNHLGAIPANGENPRPRLTIEYTIP